MGKSDKIYPMVVRKILTVPNPILREKSKRVNPPIGEDKKITNLVKDLIDTARAAEEPKSVGLSAVQIGKLVRIFVIKRGKKFVPFINPKIVWQSKKLFSQVLKKDKQFLEGCLSVPGYYGFVDRPYEVKLKWQDFEGKIHQGKFEDKESAYVQHELDHLDGILFVNRILEQKARLPSPGAKATGGQGKIYRLERDKEGKEIFVEVEIV